MAKTKGLSLNATTHLNQWVGINGLNIDPRSAAAVASRPVYGTRAGVMTADLGLLAPVVARANVDLTGITTVKDGAKLAAAIAYGVITDNCYSFALQYNMTDLQAQMLNSTEPKIYKEKDGNFAGRCTNLNAVLAALIVANPVTAIAYFTTAQLTAAALLVGTYTGKLGLFKVAESDVKSAKKEFSVTWMPKMKAHIKFMTKMLSGAITTGFPAYAGSFMGLLKLDNVGRRDQGFQPTVLDDATGLPFANIARIEPTNYPPIRVPKLGKSDGSGDFKTLKLKIGLWRIKVSVPGYFDQFIMVKVTSKEVIKMIVRMKAM
jgi:hypothetical protein